MKLILIIISLCLISCSGEMKRTYIFSITITKVKCFNPSSGFLSSTIGECIVQTKEGKKCTIYRRPVMEGEIIKVCSNVYNGREKGDRECGTHHGISCNFN